MVIYRLILTLGAPLLVAIALWRIARRRESWCDLAERLGAGDGTPGAIWLHGASNGELASAKSLVLALLAAFPDQPVLITANTLSARAMVRGWGLAGVTARLAPVDLRLVLIRFRARWRPVAQISLENEMWANRIVTSAAPVVIVAARMSARSAARWRWLAALTRRMFLRIARLYPQDAESGARFVALGLPAGNVGAVAMLKSGVEMPPPPPQALAAFAEVFRRHETVLAASTHAGDEEIVLNAFVQARAALPGLRLILAPRHPRRSAEVVRLVQATGLPYALRSAGQMPDGDCAIYIADTLGEMALWYAVAGLTVIGGTFTDRGGHTPFEPVQAGSAVIHGPDVANFADSYARLAAVDAARQVSDAAALAAALVDLADPGAQTAMAARATGAMAGLDQSAGVIADIVADLRQRIGGS